MAKLETDTLRQANLEKRVEKWSVLDYLFSYPKFQSLHLLTRQLHSELEFTYNPDTDLKRTGNLRISIQENLVQL